MLLTFKYINKYRAYWFCCMLSILFMNIDSSAQNKPHFAFGDLYYSDGNSPSSIVFDAYIVSRPGDVLNQGSLGCGYDAEQGRWFVQCGSFFAQWNSGDVLRVVFNDNQGRSGSIEAPLTTAASDYVGNTTLTLNPHPCKLLVEDRNIIHDQNIAVNIYMENLTVADSLIAYEITLGFNNEAIRALGAESQGTMTRNWGSPVAAPKESELVIGGYTTNRPGARLVDDNNILVKAMFKVEDAFSQLFFPETLVSVISARLYTLDEEIVLSHSKTGVLKEDGAVRIQTEPQGLQFMADEEVFIAPRIFNWETDEVHWIEAVSPQYYDELVGFTFAVWSHGAPRRHQILVEERSVIYTAYYDTIYYLDVRSEYGLPAGGGWHIKGSAVQVSVDSLIQESDTSRRRFTGWTGEGAGSVTASNREITVIIHEPIIQTAAWVSQYKMFLSAYPDDVPGISVNADPPGPWYDINTVVELSAAAENSQYYFSGWSGDVQSSEPVISVTVQSALNIIANFNIDGQPPRISGFPVFNIKQNEMFERTFEWLSNYVEDDNDSLEDLAYDFSENEYVSCEVGIEAKIFRIIPAQDWTGHTEVVFTVENSRGLSAETVLDIHVFPEDDSPGDFYLISPKDTTISTWPATVNFVWSKSATNNPNHLISYDFYISPNYSLAGQGTIVYSGLSDTTLTLRLQDQGEYYWSVWAEDSQENRTRADTIYQISLTTSVNDDIQLPGNYYLSQNYPNPFNQSTVFKFSMPQYARVKMVVYDTVGKQVKTLLDEYLSTGTHKIAWDGMDSSGLPAASGIYILSMRAEDFTEQRKMILLR